MRIVTCLPLHLRCRASLALSHHHLVDAASWSDVAAVVADGGADLVILDPVVAGMPGAPADAPLLERAPPTPLLLYTEMTSDAMRAVFALSRHPRLALAIAGYDDAPDKLRAIVATLPLRLLGDELLERLGHRLQALPPSVAAAIAQLFRAPAGVRDVAALAGRAGLQRRTLDRWIARAGLPPARQLLLAARLLHVAARLAGGEPLEQILQGTDYGAPRQLATLARRLRADAPRALHDGAAPAALADAVAAQLERARRPHPVSATAAGGAARPVLRRA